jgi:hypothetical protein
MIAWTEANQGQEENARVGRHSLCIPCEVSIHLKRSRHEPAAEAEAGWALWMVKSAVFGQPVPVFVRHGNLLFGWAQLELAFAIGGARWDADQQDCRE